MSAGGHRGGRGLPAALRAELAAWRAERRATNARAATLSRVRQRLGIPGLEQRLGELDAAYARDINQAWRLLDGQEHRLGRIERLVQLATVMDWVDQATLRTEPLVSVVVPTRDRPTLLRRAIESVLAQSYPNWELIVSDDAAGDDAAAVAASFDDARIRHISGPPAGASAARNRGIDAVSGPLIAYLDDDNRMHPNWLKAVVWAFEQRPEAEVLYGAIVIDDTSHLHGGAPELPSVWLERYDPETIVESNVADSSAIAHRSGLETRFDEELETVADWDFMLRATIGREPLTLPAIAAYYHTDADGRLSELEESQRRDRAAITARARAARGAQ